MWFLFNDVLLYCEKKQRPEAGKLFDFISSLSIADIHEVKEDIVLTDKQKVKKGKKFGFSIAVDGADWLLYASSAEEKKEWVNDLLLLVMQHRKRLSLAK